MPPAIVTGYTAARMDEILASVVKAVTVNGSGHLIATLYNNSTVDLGSVLGAKGDKGDTGPPGTAGVWFKDITPQAINPVDTTYKTAGTIVIPTATYARWVVLWSQISFVALSTDVTVYRAAIRDNSSGTPATVSHLPWYCNDAGLSGNIGLVTEPISIPANQAKTFISTVRRDTGSGGQTDGDSAITKFTALVTAA